MVNSTPVTDAYHEQCDALEQEGYEPRFISLTPIAYTTLLAEAQCTFLDEGGRGVYVDGRPVVVNPSQDEPVVVVAAASTEILGSRALTEIRRGLWIKHLKQELEHQDQQQITSEEKGGQ